MTAAPKAETRLIERLPDVRGRYIENAPLARNTWFRTGGQVEVMFRPADHEDLAAFLAARPADVPVTVIGVGSNLLVRDGGVPGVVLRLGRGFASIDIDGSTVKAGAGAFDLKVALTCQNAGVAGLGSSIPYCASKAALNNLTVTLARVLGPTIRVNAVAPGFIEGSWLKKVCGDRYDDVKAANEARAVLGSVSQPEDVSAAILAFITGSDNVTGQLIVHDGGDLIGPKLG